MASMNTSDHSAIVPSRRAVRRLERLSADAAVAKITSHSMVAICGAGGGVTEPTAVLQALAQRFRTQSEPQGLGLIHATGLGDRGDRGMSPLAQPGLCSRVIGGHWAQSPRLAEMAERNEIEAYNLPQGVISQLFRATAAGQPGVLTHVGLGTFVDPRQGGGKLNARTTQDLVQLLEINGAETLFYPAQKIDVAIIRATTADADGYLSMEDEVAYLDVLAMAQAAHNSGGLVIAQVQRVVRAGSLHPRSVRVPGFLVDILVEVPEQSQLYAGPGANRFLSGDYQLEEAADELLPLTERKVIARRALMEAWPGDVANVGVGICDGIGIVAREEGVDDAFTLTVETGAVGGVSAQGMFFGATVNMRALMDMPSQFDFYDGGGLDVCFLSFAEFDRSGNVNVHRFNGRLVGSGGFINISQNSRRVVFCGTLTAGGFQARIEGGAIRVEHEGRFCKLVDQVAEVTFSGAQALARGQDVLYLTERAVFRLTAEGVVLTEIAAGMDPERDVIAHMGFRPVIAPDLLVMDPRLFGEQVMDIRAQWLARGI